MDLVVAAAQRNLEEEGLYTGRMLSGSKSMYLNGHPTHTVFFNACVFVKVGRPWRRPEYRQVWWGDIDIDVDGTALQRIANRWKTVLYVTRESPFCWEGLTGKDLRADTFSRVRIYKPQS